jgi:hypothetical protein
VRGEDGEWKFSVEWNGRVFIDPSINHDHFVGTTNVGTDSDRVPESYSDVQRDKGRGGTMMEYGLNFSHVDHSEC